MKARHSGKVPLIPALHRQVGLCELQVRQGYTEIPWKWLLYAQRCVSATPISHWHGQKLSMDTMNKPRYVSGGLRHSTPPGHNCSIHFNKGISGGAWAFRIIFCSDALYKEKKNHEVEGEKVNNPESTKTFSYGNSIIFFKKKKKNL